MVGCDAWVAQVASTGACLTLINRWTNRLLHYCCLSVHLPYEYWSDLVTHLSTPNLHFDSFSAANWSFLGRRNGTFAQKHVVARHWPESDQQRAKLERLHMHLGVPTDRRHCSSDWTAYKAESNCWLLAWTSLSRRQGASPQTPPLTASTGYLQNQSG